MSISADSGAYGPLKSDKPGVKRDLAIKAGFGANVNKPLTTAPCGCKTYPDGTVYKCLSHRFDKPYCYV